MMIRQSAPIGYVNQENAQWLIKRIAADGHVQGETEFCVLFCVLNEAMDATDILVDFALQEVKAAIMQGEGYIGRQRTCDVGRISLDDVKMIETVLYASGGDGNVSVREIEAEILFDINDRCEAGPEASEAWQSLFVYAVTNSVMFYSPYKMADREEMLQNEAWINGQQSHLSNMGAASDFSGAFSDLFGFSRRRDRREYEQKQAEIEAKRAQSERIVEYEASGSPSAFQGMVS